MTATDLSLFQMAFQQAWNSVVITSADPATGYAVETANPSFCRMTGYSLDELKGRSLKMLQGPGTDPEVLARMRACLREARYFEGMATNYRKDGEPYVVRWNISPVRNEAGELTHFVSVQQDMTDYVRSDEKGRVLAKALDATSDPVLLTDARARIIFVNEAFAKLTGYPVEELVSRTPAVLRSGAHDDTFYLALREALQSGRNFKADFINRRRDGSLYHTEQNISPLKDDKGVITHYISVSRDITDRVEQERVLREAATLDRLTGLYNRHAGDRLLAESLQGARAHGHSFTLLLCDIDHFKQINDRYGHPVGDRVLRAVADVLRQSVRASDPVVRWGGEEFLVILNRIEPERAVELAERMRSRVEARQDDEVGRVTVSMGLASLRAQEPLEALITRCDQALYESKRSGRNRLTTD